MEIEKYILISSFFNLNQGFKRTNAKVMTTNVSRSELLPDSKSQSKSNKRKKRRHFRQLRNNKERPSSYTDLKLGILSCRLVLNIRTD